MSFIKNLLFFFFFVSVLLTNFSFASYKRFYKDSKNINQGHGVNEYQLKKGYNAPFNLLPNNNHQFIFKQSFLWWRAQEQNLDYLVFVSAQPANKTSFIVEPNFQHKAGFKIALGSNLFYDNWEFLSEYTRLKFRDSQSKGPTNPGSLYPTWKTENTVIAVNEGKSRWKLDFNTFDLELARSYFSGKKITNRTSLGLKTGWINQRYYLYYGINANSVYANAFAASKSFLAGPRAGFSSMYDLFSGFKIKLVSAFSMLYQDFYKIKSFDESDANASNFSSYTKDETSQITPAFELGLGALWGEYILNGRIYFDLEIRYDFQRFFNQNQMRNLCALSKTSNATSSTNIGDLDFRGLTALISFNF
jgi:hypothetical protein